MWRFTGRGFLARRSLRRRGVLAGSLIAFDARPVILIQSAEVLPRLGCRSLRRRRLRPHGFRRLPCALLPLIHPSMVLR